MKNKCINAGHFYPVLKPFKFENLVFKGMRKFQKSFKRSEWPIAGYISKSWSNNRPLKFASVHK